MKAITLFRKILDSYFENANCGIHQFGLDVIADAASTFGDFNAAILPKPGQTYFYLRLDVTSKPIMSEPDAILIQGAEGVPMVVYLWQLD